MMNDFTKDGLEYLFQLAQYQSAENINVPLINKIQAIIDNYCAHNELYTDYDSQPIRCKSCKDIVNE